MQNHPPKKIKVQVFISSSSSGHIIPLVTLNNKEKEKYATHSILIAGNSDLEKEIIEKNKQFFDEYKKVFLEKAPYHYNFLFKIIYGFKVFFYILFFIYFFYKHEVNELYTTGTYLAIPASLAAKVSNIPIYLYSLDAVPGLSNKIISYYGTHNYICFDETKKYLKTKDTIIKVSYPIRFNQNDIQSKKEACKLLNIDPSKNILLILGGSQGALEINNLVLDFIKNNKGVLSSYYFLHQAGKHDYERVKAFYDNNHIQGTVVDYCNMMNIYYSATDKIVSRAGAGSIAEIIFFKKQALLIPLKDGSNGHQIINAEYATKENPLIHFSLYENDLLINDLKNFIIAI